MSFEQHHCKFGNVFGILYRFHQAGIGLPVHAHDSSTAHNVIVLKGKILFTSVGEALGCDIVDVVSAGEILNFDWSKPHEIEALESGTEILNLFLNGQPEGYEALPDSEKHVVFP